MRFKRDWRVIHRDLYGTLFFGFIVLTVTLFIPLLLAKNYQIILDLFLSFLLFSGSGILCFYSAGTLTNTIILDSKGITLQRRKKPQQQIRWEEVTQIIRTKYIGGKAIVFWGAFYGSYNDEIWFYNNKKIENYILSIRPELQSLFPDKKDYRKWKNWNVKLRW